MDVDNLQNENSMVLDDRTFNESYDRKTHVPWLNRFELQVVVEDIYSFKLERQRRGYEKLLLWKARFPRLPVGIECTMELLRVHIVNEEVRCLVEKGEKAIYAEHDLQLMFSSVLTRSINQLSFVSQGDTKFYRDLETKLNIPRWIINLRHEAAHRTTLPAISKLVLGIQYLLEWLHTNYWKETNSFPSWIVSKSNDPLISNPTFKVMFDVWQSMKMFEVTGHEDLSECDQSGTIQETIRKELGIKLKTKSVPEAVNCLFESLVMEIKYHCKAYRSDTVERLCSILLESDTFIPKEEVLNVAISFKKGKENKEKGYKGEKEKEHTLIVKWMQNFWSALLRYLQNTYSFFPGLIRKLLLLLNTEKSSYRQLIVALWIKVICKSMDMSSDLKTLGRSSAKKRRKIETLIRRSYLRGGIFCSPQDVQSNYCSLEVLKYAVLNPSGHTSLFLPSLLKVTRPVIPDDLQNDLKILISLYLGEEQIPVNDHIPVNHHIHTVEELTGQSIKRPKTEDLSSFFWEKASAQEWAACPLGVLPWQKGSLPTLDFPPHVKWESKVEDHHYDHSELNDINFRKDLDESEMYLAQESVIWKKEQRFKGKSKIPLL